MKNILLIFLSLFFLSCSTEQDNSSSFIPERFVGDWISPYGFSAEIKTNKITIETEKELITRTKGTTIEDNKTTLFRTDINNNEQLLLLLREREQNTKEDDIIGISFYRDGELINNRYYYRR